MRIHERFLEQAARTPNAVAIAVPGRTLTYGWLAARVRSRASALAQRVPVGALVAMHRQKTPEAIADLLACLLAGCAYVPIDPGSPTARARFVLEDSGAQVLLVDAKTRAAWPSLPSGVVALGDEASGDEGFAGRASTPASLAYLLYTSGSTGTPKGVAVSHENASAFVDWALAAFDVGPDDRVAVHAPLHFDLPVLDVYVALARGAALCPIDETTLLFPEGVLRFLQEQKVTVLYAVPSALIALLKRSSVATTGLGGLRLLLYAGEEFHPPRLRELVALLPGRARVFNLYGPVETNVVTWQSVTAETMAEARVPIGRAVPHARLFLRDDDGALIPPSAIGVQGELLVGGPSVSPGYWGRPELTEAAQVVIDGVRCHRTGDYASWRSDGGLDFHGRRDGQIKSRGFRIDLGEIEAVLSATPDLAEIAAVGVPHPELTSVVVAFAVPREGAARDEASLLDRCRERLPSYMVPSKVFWRDALPHTSTGKVDRAGLVAQALAETSR